MGKKELKEAVEKLQEELEELDLEPAPGDYIKTPCGSLGSKICVGQVDEKFVGEFKDDDEADKVICEKMQKDQFYPTVWFLSDHGNLSIDTSFTCNGKKKE